MAAVQQHQYASHPAQLHTAASISTHNTNAKSSNSTPNLMHQNHPDPPNSHTFQQTQTTHPHYTDRATSVPHFQQQQQQPPPEPSSTQQYHYPELPQQQNHHQQQYQSKSHIGGRGKWGPGPSTTHVQSTHRGPRDEGYHFQSHYQMHSRHPRAAAAAASANSSTYIGHGGARQASPTPPTMRRGQDNGFGTDPYYSRSEPGALPSRSGYDAPSSSVMSGFYFKRRSERLDWRMLAALQIDRIQREVDIESLQEVMENITFCDVDAEDIRYVDPNFLKLFRIAQLIIEYLLHSQDYLADHRAALLQDVESLDLKLEMTTDAYEKQTAEFSALKKENRTLRKTLYAYQLMAKIPGGQSDGGPVSVASYHRCNFCSKVFKGPGYLENHILKRHPDVYQSADDLNYLDNSPNPIFNGRYKNEPPLPKKTNLANSSTTDRGTSIRDLQYQQQYQQQQSNKSQLPDNVVTTDIMEMTLERFSNKMMETEKLMRIEMEAKLAKEIKQRQEKFEKEKLEYELELQELKGCVHQQLAEERATFAEEKAALESLLRQTKDKSKKSRLGSIEDDDGERPHPIVFKSERAESPKHDFRSTSPTVDATLLAQIEDKQEKVMQNITMKFSKELEDIKAHLMKESEKEKKMLEERLGAAASQISTLQQALEKERLENESRDASLKQAIDKKESPNDLEDRLRMKLLKQMEDKETELRRQFEQQQIELQKKIENLALQKATLEASQTVSQATNQSQTNTILSSTQHNNIVNIQTTPVVVAQAKDEKSELSEISDDISMTKLRDRAYNHQSKSSGKGMASIVKAATAAAKSSSKNIESQPVNQPASSNTTQTSVIQVVSVNPPNQAMPQNEQVPKVVVPQIEIKRPEVTQASQNDAKKMGHNLTWEKVMELLNLHSKPISTSTSPSVKSFSEIPIDKFKICREDVQKQLEEDLKKNGLTHETIVLKWDQPEVQDMYNKQFSNMNQELSKKEVNNELYSKLKGHLEDSINQATTSEFKPTLPAYPEFTQMKKKPKSKKDDKKKLKVETKHGSLDDFMKEGKSKRRAEKDDYETSPQTTPKRITFLNEKINQALRRPPPPGHAPKPPTAQTKSFMPSSPTKAISALTGWLRGKREALKSHSTGNIPSRKSKSYSDSDESESENVDTSEDSDSSNESDSEDDDVRPIKSARSKDQISIDTSSSSESATPKRSKENLSRQSHSSVEKRSKESLSLSSRSKESVDSKSKESLASRSRDSLASDSRPSETKKFLDEKFEKKQSTNMTPSSSTIREGLVKAFGAFKSSSNQGLAPHVSKESIKKSEGSLLSQQKSKSKSLYSTDDDDSDSANDNDSVDSDEESSEKTNPRNQSNSSQAVKEKDKSKEKLDDSSSDDDSDSDSFEKKTGVASPRIPRRSMLMTNWSSANNRSTGTIPEEESEERSVSDLTSSNRDEMVEMISPFDSQKSSNVNSNVGLNKTQSHTVYNTTPIVVQSKSAKNTKNNAKSDDSFEISELSDASEDKSSDSDISLKRPTTTSTYKVTSVQSFDKPVVKHQVYTASPIQVKSKSKHDTETDLTDILDKFDSDDSSSNDNNRKPKNESKSNHVVQKGFASQGSSGRGGVRRFEDEDDFDFDSDLSIENL